MSAGKCTAKPVCREKQTHEARTGDQMLPGEGGRGVLVMIAVLPTVMCLREALPIFIFLTPLLQPAGMTLCFLHQIGCNLSNLLYARLPNACRSLPHTALRSQPPAFCSVCSTLLPLFIFARASWAHLSWLLVPGLVSFSVLNEIPQAGA